MNRPTEYRWLPWILVGAAALTGVALRVVIFTEPTFGDEMSTLWIVSGNDLAGVVTTVRSDAEISPPFYFLIAELFTVFGDSISSIRLPSLLAGILVIPVFYLVALRSLGQRAAWFTTAIASLSPFLVWFSANARAYSLMILLIMLATLALLSATSEKGRWWHWAAWAVASALAVYSHYVAALAIAGQVIWVLACFPKLRLRVIGWSFFALLLFLPWLGGLRADLDSPTSDILQALQATGFDAKFDATVQLLFLRIDQGSIPLFWDRPDMLLALAGMLIATCAAASRLARGDLRLPRGDRGRGVLLALFMTMAVILGELALLAVGTDIYGARNLAPAWAGIPLLLGALCAGAGGVAGIVSIVLIAAGFSWSSIWLADPGNSTIAYADAADLIESRDSPGGAVLDGSILSPAPQTPLDAYLDTDMRIERLTNLKDEPDFIENIYADYDPQLITDRAFASQGPVELVTLGEDSGPVAAGSGRGSRYRFPMGATTVLIPSGWQVTARTTFEGLVPLTVTRFEKSGTPAGDKGQ